MDSEPDSYTIAARITDTARGQVQTKISEWFGNTSEHEAYDLEAVMELGRHVI